MNKVRVKIDDEWKELSTDSVKFIDNGEEKGADDYVLKSYMNETVRNRVNETKSSVKEELESDDWFRSKLEERGFQYNDEGLIVPTDDDKAKDARIKQYNRWQTQYEKSNVEPLKNDLESTKQELNNLRRGILTSEIKNAAHEAGVKAELLKPIGNGKAPIVNSVMENFDYFDTGEQKGWFVKDGDSFKVSENGPATVSDFFQGLKQDDDYAHLFKEERDRSSGFSTTSRPRNRHSGKNADYYASLPKEEFEKAWQNQ